MSTIVVYGEQDPGHNIRGVGHEEHCRFCGRNITTSGIYCSRKCAVEAAEHRLWGMRK